MRLLFVLHYSRRLSSSRSTLNVSTLAQSHSKPQNTRCGAVYPEETGRSALVWGG